MKQETLLQEAKTKCNVPIIHHNNKTNNSFKDQRFNLQKLIMSTQAKRNSIWAL